MIKRILIFAFVIAIVSSLAEFSLIRQSLAALRSTDHFLVYENNSMILYEPGAEKYAIAIAEFLNSDIRQIERRQYRPFQAPVRVFICSSRESFKKYYGADVRAGVLVKLFLSPRVFDDGAEIAEMYITHELSHLHIRDQVGNYRMSRLPGWFKEGLAAYVSEGGGAHTVSEKQAIDAIKAGNHFVPQESGSFLFQKTAVDWGLKPHMYYRQSMMFVRFLALTDEEGFRKLLLAVENGESFSAAFVTAYNKSLDVLWNDFLSGLKLLS